MTDQKDLAKELSTRVVGQPAATKAVIPYIEMFLAGLSPEDRPAGIFLLLGPSGTGKTKTVEALAEILHGSARSLLTVNCGEFQMNHEVAKLIGSPPGYLGHRETQPILAQQRLNAATSEKCGLSLVLFDEIEKAAPTLDKLLLGILDKGRLRLGDNSAVNFSSSLIFLTSNLGSREMMREINPEFGFQAPGNTNSGNLGKKLEGISRVAVHRRFSPEFLNRIDAIVTYQPLSQESLWTILDGAIWDLQGHLNTRLGEKSFSLDVPVESRSFLLQKGTSAEYGARELNRTIHRYLMQPLAVMVATGCVRPGSTVQATLNSREDRLDLCASGGDSPQPEPVRRLLIVDNNHDLLGFLAQGIARSAANFEVVTAHSAKEACALTTESHFEAVLFEYLLPDGNGVEMAVMAKQQPESPELVMVYSAAALPPEEEELCDEHKILMLRKPCLPTEITNVLNENFNTWHMTTGGAV